MKSICAIFPEALVKSPKFGMDHQHDYCYIFKTFEGEIDEAMLILKQLKQYFFSLFKLQAKGN